MSSATSKRGGCSKVRSGGCAARRARTSRSCPSTSRSEASSSSFCARPVASVAAIASASSSQEPRASGPSGVRRVLEGGVERGERFGIRRPIGIEPELEGLAQAGLEPRLLEHVLLQESPLGAAEISIRPGDVEQGQEGAQLGLLQQGGVAHAAQQCKATHPVQCPGGGGVHPAALAGAVGAFGRGSRRAVGGPHAGCHSRRRALP